MWRNVVVVSLLSGPVLGQDAQLPEVSIELLEFIGLADGFEEVVAWPDETEAPGMQTDDTKTDDEQGNDNG